MTVFTVLKAELINHRGGKARFCAEPGRAEMLVVIRRKRTTTPAWAWRRTMTPDQARVLYRKLVKEGWVKVVLE